MCLFIDFEFAFEYVLRKMKDKMLENVDNRTLGVHIHLQCKLIGMLLMRVNDDSNFLFG